MTGPRRIKVGGPRPYEVVVGTGLLGELPGLVGDAARTILLVHDSGLGRLAAEARDVLGQAGYRVVIARVPAGEAAKEFTVLRRLWAACGQARVTRSDAVVALGGGSVSDVAGFAAATWLRGVRVVLVPTTLLAMADAAIGGKTAINVAAGKNLVGAFHPPAGVLADLRALASLPSAEYASGLAEVIKAGFIADPVILDLVGADPAGAARPGGPHEQELIERAIAVKASVVSIDLREAGPRETLNYGHTLGHAIERVEGFRRRHGEAVAIGMCYAAALSRLAGRLDETTAARHASVLSAVGLPTRYRGDAWPELRAAMELDKKARADRPRLVVLDGLARPAMLEDPPEELLERAYAEVC